MAVAFFAGCAIQAKQSGANRMMQMPIFIAGRLSKAKAISERWRTSPEKGNARHRPNTVEAHFDP